MKLPETDSLETPRTWLAIGERAERALSQQVGRGQRVLPVPGLHAALGLDDLPQIRGCLAEATFFRARPDAGLDVLRRRLGSAPLWLLAPPIDPEVEAAARRRSVPVWRAEELRAPPPSSSAAPTSLTFATFLEGCASRQGRVARLVRWFLDAFTGTSGARRASFLLRHPRREDLVVRGRALDGHTRLLREGEAASRHGPAAAAAACGRVRAGYAHRPAYRGRAYVVVPCVVDGRAIGVVCLTDFVEDALPPAEVLEAWSTWAGYGGRFLSTALELERARSSAQVDTRTGLPNHSAFLAELRREHERCVRRGGAYGVLVFDIDHFKQANTELTHPVADRVLENVARQLRRSFREADFVARWGGEEFAVLLTDPTRPATTGSGEDGAPAAGDAGDLLLLAAERARTAVERNPTRLPGRATPWRATVSGGLAVYPDDGRDPARLEGAAFEALGRAKTEGRNRVERGRRRPGPPA